MGIRRQVSDEVSQADHQRRQQQQGFQTSRSKGKSRYEGGEGGTSGGATTTPRGRRSGGGHGGGPPPCQIFQDDFLAFLEMVESFRFKVHKPGCQCSKVKNIRERNSLANGCDELHRSLIVVPDCGGRFLPAAYLYPVPEAAGNDTSATLLTHELKLKDVIFPPDGPSPDIKVSCAACLLEGVPNGFSCVNSTTSRIAVEYARDEARKNAQSLRDSGKKLHADHADEVVILESKLLRSVARSPSGKKGGPQSPSIDDHKALRDHLEEEGMDMTDVKRINLGHHIQSLLRTMKNKDYFFLAIAFRDELVQQHYHVVSIELDLPGGKRHLGESSFDCAIRETLEETSLLIDDTWHAGDGMPLKNASNDDFCNAFYDLHPPPRQASGVEELGEALSHIRISGAGV